MNKKYVVRLEPPEREELQKLVSKGKAAARKLTHARILLESDRSEAGPGWTDEQISTALGVTTRTVEHVRQRCVEEGLGAALERKKRETPARERILDGAKEARLVVPARRDCSQPPKGRRSWTLSRRAGTGGSAGGTRYRRIDIAEHGAPCPKKNELKPWRKKMWCIPPESRRAGTARIVLKLDQYQSDSTA